MEELKRLIREDKEVIAVLDTHISDLKVVLQEFKKIVPMFQQFLDEQRGFMSSIKSFVEKK